MTCNEIRDRVETSSLRTLAEGVLSAEIAAHIEHCSSCRRWIETEEQLSSHLRLLRDSVPTIPATLDGSVLHGYREHLQHASDNIVPLNTPVGFTSNLVWRAAIAALLLVGAIIIFGSRKATSPPTIANVQPQPIALGTQPQTQAKSETPRPGGLKKIASRAHQRNAVPRSATASAEAASNTLPPDFRNLMYCDQLSCSGAMDVIRVNFPASALGMASPLRTSNVVAADVVVGPDGVARAIRIVN
jgi:hypothetical protein